eukprot:jgi/Chrzof1/6489/Cz18g13070.t1_GLYK
MASSKDSFVKYICSGPLLKVCGITAEDVQRELETWERLGRRLAVQLKFDYANMDDIQRLRIYHYYLPVALWVHKQYQQHLQRHAGTTPPPAMVLGISAPQGCGKTTLVEQLEQLFNWLGTTAASVSIDDFYLTYHDQIGLAAAHPDNRLLQGRGNAGTHDLQLGSKTLQELKQHITDDGQTAALPRYDKSAYHGRGDRADPASWPKIKGPLQILFFEGWMLGFKPVSESAAADVESSLVEVNARLAAYEAAWDAHVDAWLVVKITDPQWVFGWRLQAEHQMRSKGKPGMTDDQVAEFVSRYIPPYEAYLPGLYAHGPTTATPGHTLIIEVDKSRAPVAIQPKPVV